MDLGPEARDSEANLSSESRTTSEGDLLTSTGSLPSGTGASSNPELTSTEFASNTSEVPLGGTSGSFPTTGTHGPVSENDADHSTSGPVATEATGPFATEATGPFLPGSETDAPAIREFFDDFDREAGPDLGNGWIERDPTVWAIENGYAVAQESPGETANVTLFHRGLDEQATDIEVAAEFQVLSPFIRLSPQIGVRLQPPSTEPNLESYTGYTALPEFDGSLPEFDPNNDVGTLCIRRFLNNHLALNNFECENLEDAQFRSGQRYRLTLRVTGEYPVELTATLERLSEAETWVNVAVTTWTDDDRDRVVGPGVWGLSEGGGRGNIRDYGVDNFRATILDEVESGATGG